MKLDDLENARKAQKKSDRHFYFDDSGSIKYYGRASSDDYVEYHQSANSYLHSEKDIVVGNYQL